MSRTVPALLLILVALAAVTACAPEDRDDRLAALARWEDRRLAPQDSLATFLAARDPVLRRAALRTAGLIGRTESLPAMIERLDDSSQAVRAQAAFSLGLLGGEVAVPPLTAALDDPHRSVRIATTEGLAHQQHDGSILFDLALNGDKHEAAAAWTALRNVANLADHDSLVAVIRTGLARGENEVRWRVLRCAERVPDAGLVDQIAAYIVDGDIQVRVHALRALSRQTGDAALDAVLHSNERHGRLRGLNLRRVEVAELRALGRLAGPVLAADQEGDHTSPAGRTAAILNRGAQSTDPQVAETALYAMASATAEIDLPEEAMRQESLLPVWRIRMARAAQQRLDDPAPAVRGAAIQALGSLRRDGARPFLIDQLDDPDPAVAAAAVQALVALDLPASDLRHLRQECSGQDPPVEVAMLAGLAELWPETVCEDTTVAAEAWLSAAAGLRSTDFTVRTTAATLASRFITARASQSLADAYRASADLTEGRSDVCLEVIRAWQHLYSAWPDSAASEPHQGEVAGILRGAFDDPDLRIRLAARDCAVATNLLPARLVPAAASLRETMPAFVRSPRQPAVALPHDDAVRVRCITERGTFVIELDPEAAPNTCATFLDLVESGFHDDLTFHRVVPDFVIQGGCPRGDGWGGPGWTIRSEWSRLPFRRGAVGIAHSGKDTGGSQWFICHSAQPHLDARYTVFGEVVSGLEIVDRIERGDHYRLEIEDDGRPSAGNES